MTTKNITAPCFLGKNGDKEQSLIHNISRSITRKERLCAVQKLCDFWKEKNCSNHIVENALRSGVVSVLIKLMVYVLYRGYENVLDPNAMMMEELELITQALDIVHRSVSTESIQKYCPIQSLLLECVNLLKFCCPKCQDSNTKNTKSQQRITEYASNILLHLSRIVLFDGRHVVSFRCASEIMQHLTLCLQLPSNRLIQSRSVRTANNFICSIIISKDDNPFTSQNFGRALWGDNTLEKLFLAVVDLFSSLLGTSECKDHNDSNQFDSNDRQTIHCVFALSTLIINLTTILKSQLQKTLLLKQKIIHIDKTVHDLMSILSLSLSLKTTLSRNLNLLFKIKFNAINALLNFTLTLISLFKQPFKEEVAHHIEQKCIHLWVVTIIPTIIKNYRESKEKQAIHVNENKMTIDNGDLDFDDITKIQNNLKYSKETSTHNTELVLMNEIFKAVNLIVHITSSQCSHMLIPSMGLLTKVAKTDIKMNSVTLLKAMAHLSILLINQKETPNHEQHFLPSESENSIYISYLDALAVATFHCMSNETHRNCHILAWAYQKLSTHPVWLGQMSQHSETISCLIALLLYEGDTSPNECAAALLLNLSHSRTDDLIKHINLLIPALLHSALTNKDLIINELVLCTLTILADRSESVCCFLMSKNYAQKAVMLFSQAATPPGLVVVGAQKALQKLLTFDIVDY